MFYIGGPPLIDPIASQIAITLELPLIMRKRITTDILYVRTIHGLATLEPERSSACMILGMCAVPSLTL